MITMTVLALTMNPLMISVVAFIGVAGLITAGFQLFENSGSSSVEDRLDVLAGKKAAKAEGSTQVTREALVQEGMGGLAELAAKLTNRFSHFKLLFVQADTTLKPEKFLLLSAGAAGLGVFVAMTANSSLPFYPLYALAGGLLPFVWLMFRRNRRFKAFAGQLPQAMELIARALRSGHSLASAMRVVVDELPDPISKEFNIAYEEQNLGVPIEQALKNVYYRMPNMDYKFFSMAVAIQRQSGGDLAEILDKIGHIIRERFRILGQVQALTGEGRISGIVLMALPIALFFAVWKLNPDYVMMLFTDPLGRQMVAGAVVLQIIGAYAIKKIVAIKV